MGVIQELASVNGERGDTADIALAARIAETGDTAALRELVDHLDDPDQGIRSDCVKTLYETGYRNPALLVPHAGRFLKLLAEKNNRLVWGGMIALSTIAEPAAAVIHRELPLIRKTMGKGSVITVDAGVRVLAGMGVSGEAYGEEIRPILLEHFRTYPVKYLPNHAEMAERCFLASGTSAAEFAAVLKTRSAALSGSALKRMERIIKRLEKGTRG